MYFAPVNVFVVIGNAATLLKFISVSPRSLEDGSICTEPVISFW